jgi:hypothetical protein
MKIGKRRPDAEPAAEPTGVTAPPPPDPSPARPSVVGYEPPAGESGDDADAIVDAEAVELPATPPPPPAPSPTTAYVPPAPPFPVAEEPVAVVSSGPDPGGVTPLAEAGPF